MDLQGTEEAVETIETILNPEEVSSLLKRNRIKVTGPSPPKPFTSFTDLQPYLQHCPIEILSNLRSMRFSTPTPVQLQCLPVMLEERDLLACAPTGSGKTLVFLLPLIVNHWRYKQKGKEKFQGPTGIIVEPTRELSRQVWMEMKKLSAGTSYTSAVLGEKDGTAENTAGKLSISYKFNTHTDRQGKDLVISTPLRLVHAFKQNLINLAK